MSKLLHSALCVYPNVYNYCYTFLLEIPPKKFANSLRKDLLCWAFNMLDIFSFTNNGGENWEYISSQKKNNIFNREGLGMSKP